MLAFDTGVTIMEVVLLFCDHIQELLGLNHEKSGFVCLARSCV